MKIHDENGNEIPFYIYLNAFGGGEDGKIYREDDFKKMLAQWKTASWAEVYEYLAHLSAQVIMDAAEINRESYEEIMSVIIKVFYQNQKITNDMDDHYEAKYRRENFRVIK